MWIDPNTPGAGLKFPSPAQPLVLFLPHLENSLQNTLYFVSQVKRGAGTDKRSAALDVAFRKASPSPEGSVQIRDGVRT